MPTYGKRIKAKWLLLNAAIWIKHSDSQAYSTNTSIELCFCERERVEVSNLK